jgi:tRNA pseudouridine13 synthase
LASLSGDYRRLLHAPADLAWRLVRYADADAEGLLPRFFEEDGGVGGGADDGATRVPAAAAAAEGEGPLLALALRFTLPPSSYATMLVRELTKSSTSKGFQRGLSERQAATAAGYAAAGAGDAGDAGGDAAAAK